MRNYQFKTTRDVNQVNWTILQQLNQTIGQAWTLVGFNQGYCYGWISTDGPRVHVYLWIYGSPDWNDNAYIILPPPPVQLYPLGVAADFHQFIGPIVDADTGLAVSDEYYKITTGDDGKCHILFPNAGSLTTSGTLAGSYIRK